MEKNWAGPAALIFRMLYNLLVIVTIPLETATKFFFILRTLTYNYGPRIRKSLTQLSLNNNKLIGHRYLI